MPQGDPDDTDAYIDLVAQAVIDKIEERSRVTHLVEMVAARVIEMQKREAALQAKETEQPADKSADSATEDDRDDVGETG